MLSLNIYFLLLYFIGNSNYLIINSVPKLVWGCSQAIRLRHIYKVFYFILMNKSEMQARSLTQNFEACQQFQGRKLSEESVAVLEYSYFLSSFLGSLLCRKCGHDITTAVHLYNKASKLALRQRNDTILGVQQRLIQLFKNPHGTLIYTIVFLYHRQTISSARCRP